MFLYDSQIELNQDENYNGFYWNLLEMLKILIKKRKCYILRKHAIAHSKRFSLCSYITAMECKVMTDIPLQRQSISHRIG